MSTKTIISREQLIAQIINDFNITDITVDQWVKICAGELADRNVRYMYDGHWHVDSVVHLTKRLWSQYTPQPNYFF